MSDFLNPKKIIKGLTVSQEMNIADFGSGPGGWVIPLAKIVKNGKIYAIDVLDEALSALRSNADLENIYNFQCLRADLERGTEIQSNHLDLVIMSNLLFQADDKEAIIKEAYRVLKKGGKTIVVDWAIKDGDGQKSLENKIRKNGFKEIKRIDAGKSHFAILYEKI